MEIPEDHNEVVSPEAKRKIYSAAAELEDEKKEEDAYTKYARACPWWNKSTNRNTLELVDEINQPINEISDCWEY